MKRPLPARLELFVQLAAGFVMVAVPVWILVICSEPFDSSSPKSYYDSSEKFELPKSLPDSIQAIWSSGDWDVKANRVTAEISTASKKHYCKSMENMTPKQRSKCASALLTYRTGSLFFMSVSSENIRENDGLVMSLLVDGAKIAEASVKVDERETSTWKIHSACDKVSDPCSSITPAVLAVPDSACNEVTDPCPSHDIEAMKNAFREGVQATWVYYNKRTEESYERVFSLKGFTKAYNAFQELSELTRKGRQKAEIEFKKELKKFKKELKELHREAKISDDFSRQIEKLNEDACSTNLYFKVRGFFSGWDISCPRCGERYSVDRVFSKATLEIVEKYAVNRKLSLTQFLRYMGECY